jgi:5-methylcytosine-specific restriction endonuclease McrA
MRQWAEDHAEERRVYMRKWTEEHPEQIREQRRARYAANADQRERDSKRAVAWNRENKVRRLEITKEWDQRNPANRKESVRKWQQANPDKVRANSARRRAQMFDDMADFIPFELLAAKWSYWGGCCWMCGDEATSWDHVKPLSKGGRHCLANLRPACQPCNGRKHAKWPWPTRRSQ